MKWQVCLLSSESHVILERLKEAQAVSSHTARINSRGTIQNVQVYTKRIVHSLGMVCH